MPSTRTGRSSMPCLTRLCSIGISSSIPSRSIQRPTFEPPNRRSSHVQATKNAMSQGTLAPARPRSWLQSPGFVPLGAEDVQPAPPTTASRSCLALGPWIQRALHRSDRRPQGRQNQLLRDADARAPSPPVAATGYPHRGPAMFVAIVTGAERPAWAMMPASRLVFAWR